MVTDTAWSIRKFRLTLVFFCFFKAFLFFIFFLGVWGRNYDEIGKNRGCLALGRQKMPCSCTFRHVSIEQDQTADLIKIIPFNSMCDSNNRIVGIYIHKMYCKFGGHTNCKIHLSCLSQFSLISILLNINKALKHCDCQRIIMRTASAGSRLIMTITEFKYTLTGRDGIIVQWLLCMVFFALSNHWRPCGLYPRGISWFFIT